MREFIKYLKSTDNVIISESFQYNKQAFISTIDEVKAGIERILRSKLMNGIQITKRICLSDTQVQLIIQMDIYLPEYQIVMIFGDNSCCSCTSISLF